MRLDFTFRAELQKIDNNFDKIINRLLLFDWSGHLSGKKSKIFGDFSSLKLELAAFLCLGFNQLSLSIMNRTVKLKI